MGERSRPRDLYDVVNLYRRDDLRIRRDHIHAILVEKCAHKGIAVPTIGSIITSGRVPELESEWENMLGHQLPALPPFAQFWETLDELFRWLEGTAIAPALERLGPGPDEDRRWSPPAAVAVWAMDVPLEEIRFAAVNHLCVELGYQGRTRLIEPYSLRRTRQGALVLHALRRDSGEHRSYRVDRIEAARATATPFTPTYAVEFSFAGPLAAPPRGGRAATTRAPRPRREPRARTVAVVECPVCGKRFRRTTGKRQINAHKNSHGARCPGQGRTGRLVDTRW